MNRKAKYRTLAGLALFTPIVVLLQVIGSFIKFGPFSISLVLIPIVVGAAVFGPKAGAYLGGVFGVVVLIACITGADLGGAILWNASPFLTALICLAKGIMAGLAAGAVYTALSKKNQIVGTIVAAVVCPVVNTGIFSLGMIFFFYGILVEWAGGSSVLYYIIFGMVGLNFILEMLVNIVISPVIVRIIQTRAHM